MRFSRLGGWDDFFPPFCRLVPIWSDVSGRLTTFLLHFLLTGGRLERKIWNLDGYVSTERTPLLTFAWVEKRTFENQPGRLFEVKYHEDIAECWFIGANQKT